MGAGIAVDLRARFKCGSRNEDEATVNRAGIQVGNLRRDIAAFQEGKLPLQFLHLTLHIEKSRGVVSISSVALFCLGRFRRWRNSKLLRREMSQELVSGASMIPCRQSQDC